MKIIDNINSLLGEDLKKELSHDSKVKIAASCFSIYAFAVLKKELENIDSFQFIFKVFLLYIQFQRFIEPQVRRSVECSSRS